MKFIPMLYNLHTSSHSQNFAPDTWIRETQSKALLLWVQCFLTPEILISPKVCFLLPDSFYSVCCFVSHLKDLRIPQK